ncbi:MAG: protein phosphatase 2C domain-containing protein [Paraglaciecola sp.]|uniref:PP2C family protein-serine/threonine phosphatase n=1 Tax=Paraglaciecola sp. TaxID=1920173 RepID=UPI0032997921
MYQDAACYGDQIQGKRNYQEDTFEIKAFGDETLFLLCDGMGGHVAGKQASDLAVEEFTKGFCHQVNLPIPKRLEAGLTFANEAIKLKVLQSNELNGMGTTLVAVHLGRNAIHWVSVGDSPLWLVRDNQLQRLNADHSLAEVLKKFVKLGQITAQQAANDPKRHVLLSSVSGEEIQHIDLRESPFEMRNGDCLLLASDGLETLSAQQIIQQVKDNSEPKKCVSQLLESVETINKAHQDNATVIVYRHVCASKKFAISNLLTPKSLTIFLTFVCLVLVTVVAVSL